MKLGLPVKKPSSTFTSVMESAVHHPSGHNKKKMARYITTPPDVFIWEFALAVGIDCSVNCYRHSRGANQLASLVLLVCCQTWDVDSTFW